MSHGPTSDWTLASKLLPYARRDAPLYAIAVLIAPVSALLSVAQPWILKTVIDDHIVSGQLEGLALMAQLRIGANSPQAIIHHARSTQM